MPRVDQIRMRTTQGERKFVYNGVRYTITAEGVLLPAQAARYALDLFGPSEVVRG